MSTHFLRYYIIIGLLFIVTGAIIFYYSLPGLPKYGNEPDPTEWDKPYINSLPSTPEANLIRYGRELVINTAKFGDLQVFGAVCS